MTVLFLPDDDQHECNFRVGEDPFHGRRLRERTIQLRGRRGRGEVDAKIVCTGHGPRSIGTVLDDQHAFFKGLREQVGALMADRAPEEAKAQIESIRATLKGNPQIARFVGERGAGWDPFPAQVAKVYEELTGKKLAALMHEPQLARLCSRPLPRSCVTS